MYAYFFFPAKSEINNIVKPRNGSERRVSRARDRYFKDLPTNAVLPEPRRENLGPAVCEAVDWTDQPGVRRQP